MSQIIGCLTSLSVNSGKIISSHYLLKYTCNRCLLPMKNCFLQLQHVRYLNAAEVTTALRPFFFAVHPDLFGRYPKEREVNENSLKVLNSHLESQLRQHFCPPMRLKFYIRDKTQHTPKDLFRKVDVTLSSEDLHKTVHSILTACDLSTAYIDSLPKQKHLKKKDFFSQFTFSSSVDFEAPRREPLVRNQFNNLQDWLEHNVEQARVKQKECVCVRDEIARLRSYIVTSLQLEDLEWDCGWGTTHFRGCLQAFYSLARHHYDEMQILKGRKIVFGTESGVSLDGHVVLYSGEIRNNWLDTIKNIPHYDVILLQIPAVKLGLSQALRGIQVVHRKFQPTILVENYKSQLRRLITGILDYRSKNNFPRDWPESLSSLQMVVESEASPLMLSPTGQILVPAACPAFLLVNFITENMDVALQKIQQYEKEKHLERELHQRCRTELQLDSLEKEDSITLPQMISCCRRLLENQPHLVGLLAESRLMVTSYYSVMSDGDMCIPWNWKSRF